MLVVLGRRRLTIFDFAVLALTFAGGVNAIRGIVWFALACMVFVPVAIGHKLESKSRGEPRRRLNVGIAVGLTVALLAVAGSLFARDESWFEEYWPREAVEAVRGELGPTTACSRPTASPTGCSSRSRSSAAASPTTCASSSTKASSIDELQEYAFETAPDWKSFADGYRIVIVDETRKSHTAGLPRGAGCRVGLSRRRVTVIVRPDGTSLGAIRNTSTPSRSNTKLPARHRFEARRRTPHDLGRA